MDEPSFPQILLFTPHNTLFVQNDKIIKKGEANLLRQIFNPFYNLLLHMYVFYSLHHSLFQSEAFPHHNL